MNNKVHVKTGDTVIVISGRDRRNMVSKHVKARKMGDQAGIVQAESAIYACKVQIVCPRCGKPTRVAHKVYEDGTKERICAKCGESL